MSAAIFWCVMSLSLLVANAYLIRAVQQLRREREERRHWARLLEQSEALRRVK